MKEYECHIYKNRVTGEELWYKAKYVTKSRAYRDLLEYDVEHIDDWVYIGIQLRKTF